MVNDDTESQFLGNAPAIGPAAPPPREIDRLAQDLANCRRSLRKAHEVLGRVNNFFEHQANMNAAAHCAETVMHTPLHAQVKSTVVSIEMYDAAFGLHTEDWRRDGDLI